ncbi:hypothetical protein M6D93_01350 [Jatrophihabitans telluris]|uniref:MFS transporter n=1 Tax=Jatrophihabitans telluris TaxID=2038343 RepID=A0ABY4QYS6_9ACTN|nr:hypothetical protein [Jatrophihabitans telluris]UQX88660.1 hypothetical protein M6D93_01350 [Jatrophihabitans telluris]
MAEVRRDGTAQAGRSRFAVVLRGRPVLAATVATALVALAYLAWSPRSPDLAAQQARSAAALRGIGSSWWTSWYGGLTTFSYSVIVPAIMARLGVFLTGALALVLSAAATARLARHSSAPGLVTATAVGFEAADVVAGRTTFAVGLAAALWCLVAVDRRAWAWAALLAVASTLASPLAGMFVGIALAALWLSRRSREVAMLCGLLAVVAVGMYLLFPSAGQMPFRLTDAIPPAIGCAAVIATRPAPSVRTGALLVLAAMVVLLAVPTAIGGNIARIAWVFAVPLALTGSARLRWRIVAAVLVAVWPAADLVEQLAKADVPSAQARFYAPLLAQLQTDKRLEGASATGQRLEVLAPSSQWSAAYLAGSVPLARGWDRQADRAHNPLFYDSDGLDATTYRSWLDRMAVSWVAVPNADLDYAARAEAQLVGAGLPYLHEEWHSANWTLYRVSNPAPFIIGATTLGIDATGVAILVDHPGSVTVRVNYSRYLVLQRDNLDPAAVGCIQPTADGVQMWISQPGRYRLTSMFDPLPGLQTHPCAR